MENYSAYFGRLYLFEYRRDIEKLIGRQCFVVYDQRWLGEVEELKLAE